MESDYPFSEVESLSDSDWLDVQSGRESDIDSSKARSRRSSISSHDGLVEAWEGLVEEEPPTTTATTATIVPILPAPDGGDSLACREEGGAMEALDQSMTSTLSSSRSSSSRPSTIHSTRDLRLSFPDPLTSSLNELNQSFEDIATSDEITTTDLDDNPLSSSTIPETDAESAISVRERDQTVAETDAESSHHDLELEKPSDPDLDIFLYGHSFDGKWLFAHDVLHKVTGVDSSSTTTLTRTDVRQQFVTGLGPLFPNGVAILDFTDSTCFEKSPPTGRTSLAIIYLPVPSVLLPTHTHFLPVLACLSYKERRLARSFALASWRQLGVQDDKLLAGIDLPLLSPDDLQDISGEDIHDGLFDKVKKVRKKRSSVALSATHATAFLTVLALMLGLVIKITFHSSARVGPVKAPQSGLITTATTSTSLQTAAAVTPSATETTSTSFALAIVTVTMTTTATTAPSASETPKTDGPGTEIIARPAGALALDARVKALSLDVRTKALALVLPAQRKAEAITTALALRLTDLARVDWRARHERARSRARALRDSLRDGVHLARERAHRVRKVGERAFAEHRQRMVARKRYKRLVRKRAKGLFFGS